jgi:hypothetical protein
MTAALKCAASVFNVEDEGEAPTSAFQSGIVLTPDGASARRAHEYDDDVEEERAYVEEERAYVEEERAYLETERAYVEEHRAYVEEEERAYFEAERAYLEAERAYVEEERAYLAARRAYLEAERAYVEEEFPDLEAEHVHVDLEGGDDEDEFMIVSLEEVELLDPSQPRVRSRRGDPRRVAARAGERRDRSRSAFAERRGAPAANLPATEALAGAMGALILLVAIMIVINSVLG